MLLFILLDALIRTEYDVLKIQDCLPPRDLDIFILWYSLFAKGLGRRLQM